MAEVTDCSRRQQLCKRSACVPKLFGLLLQQKRAGNKTRKGRLFSTWNPPPPADERDHAGPSGNSCPVRRWAAGPAELSQREPAKRPKCLVILLHAALHLWAVYTKVALHSLFFPLRCRKEQLGSRKEKKTQKARSVSGLFISFLKCAK